MTTPEQRDYIGEVISEDAAEREALRWQLKGFIPGVEGSSKAVFKPWVVQAKDCDELRQQLADVSNERDLLRAALSRADSLLSICDEALNVAGKIPDWFTLIDWYANHRKPAKEQLIAYFSEKVGGVQS